MDEYEVTKAVTLKNRNTGRGGNTGVFIYKVGEKRFKGHYPSALPEGKRFYIGYSVKDPRYNVLIHGVDVNAPFPVDFDLSKYLNDNIFRHVDCADVYK
ncbi:hypothetical protein FUAX_54460 (plasmid) [Fulvitalea axinellae]|uniref:Uncharacterized protein n=2 Tax=Fulvitalea axinellae TaxID=1182444 RepID=A0AAU9D350_9BACT|nr:hypothetical protein FUAX_54460 [Fulvitalea axinellae]